MSLSTRLEKITSTLKEKTDNNSIDLSNFSKEDWDMIIEITNNEDLLAFYKNPEETKKQIKLRMEAVGAESYSEMLT